MMTVFLLFKINNLTIMNLSLTFLILKAVLITFKIKENCIKLIYYEYVFVIKTKFCNLSKGFF